MDRDGGEMKERECEQMRWSGQRWRRDGGGIEVEGTKEMRDEETRD